MYRNRLVPLLAAVGGVLCGILRAWQLTRGFEPGTNLSYSAGGLNGLLYITALLLCAGLLFFSRGYAKTLSFESMFGHLPDLAKVSLVISGIALLTGGAGFCWSMLSQEIDPLASKWLMGLELAYGIITIAAGICIPLLAARLSREGELSASTAYLTLPPLFWAAFQLLIAYRTYSVSANLPLFSYELLSELAIAMAFYHFARLLYGKPAPAQFLFFAGSAFLLALGNILGVLLGFSLGATIIAPELETLMRLVGLFGGSLVLFTFALLMTRKSLS